MRRATIILIASCLAACEAFEHMALAARPFAYATTARKATASADAIVMAAKKKGAKKPKKVATKISPKGFGARVTTPAGGRLLSRGLGPALGAGGSPTLGAVAVDRQCVCESFGAHVSCHQLLLAPVS